RVLFPFHAEVMPLGRLAARQQQASWVIGEISNSGWRYRPIPRIDHIGSRKHGEPREHNHCDEIEIQHRLFSHAHCGRQAWSGEAIELHYGTRKRKHEQSSKSHPMQDCEKIVGGYFHDSTSLNLKLARFGPDTSAPCGRPSPPRLQTAT